MGATQTSRNGWLPWRKPLGRAAVTRAESIASASGIRKEINADEVVSAISHAQRLATSGSTILFVDTLIRGSVNLSNLELSIPVAFQGCIFDAPVLISNSRTVDLAFSGSSIRSLDLSRSFVDGTLKLDAGLSCVGEITLHDAHVTGAVTLESAKLSNPTGRALDCSGAKFDSIVLLRNGFHAKGEVRFLRATIAGNLQCRAGSFENLNGTALNLNAASIKGGLYINGLTPTGKGRSGVTGDLNLQSARVRFLRDDGSAWPEHGNIVLDGFVYEHFDNCPTSAEFRRRWLLRQPRSHLSDKTFRAQPWQQAFTVLKRMGHVRDAVKIQIWKYDRMVLAGTFGFWGGIWNRVLGIVCGYGHQPWYAIHFCLGVVLLGTVVFDLGYRAGLVYPAKEEIILELARSDQGCPPAGYPVFDPWVYSLDTFMPVLDLNQEGYWLPLANKKLKCSVSPANWSLVERLGVDSSSNASAGWAHPLRAYYWLHKLAGVFLVTVAGLAFSGFLQRE